MRMTMTSRSSWWWLHVLCLLVLQHMGVSSEESTPYNGTYWGNVTTRPDQDYITNEETSGTHNITLDTSWGNVTTGPDRDYITNEVTLETHNITLDTSWGNVTTGPDQDYITNEVTLGTHNITLDTSWGNVTTGPHWFNITNEETSIIPNTTLDTYSSNVTRPDLAYVSEDSPAIPSSTLGTYTSNATIGPDLRHNHEEISGTPNTTLDLYSSNFTSGSHLTYVTNDTARTPSSAIETYPSNVTTTVDYIREETSSTSKTTQETYRGNITSGLDRNYITSKETSRTSSTTLEINLSNVTTEPDLVYNTSDGTPNATLETYPSNVTSGSHLAYNTEDTVRTSNTTIEMYPSNVTTGPDLAYTSEETTGTPFRTLEMTTTSYTGAAYCLWDADCPPFALCTKQGGLHMCQCYLGYYFHHGLGCVTARTFPARVPVSILYDVGTAEYRYNEDEIRHTGSHRVALLFQNVLGHVPGYLSTSITDLQLDEGLVTIVSSFSTLYPVTEEALWGALTVSPLLCADPHSGCLTPLTSDNYHALSLCDFDVCDSSSSDCGSHGGLVTCQCHTGYYKFSSSDRSCRACRSGYQRTENGCERCPIGFGGFNCEESYILAVIVESCVGCVLLVSLITLLVFYFRRKKPQKPMFIDSIVLGVPTDQPSLRLPRAQFSWRREWEWNPPPEKVLTDIQQEAAIPEEPAIHMKTFGDPARFSTPNTYHGRHNLSFISD